MALMSVMASQTHMYPQLVHIKYVKLFACLLYFNKVINKTKIFLHKKIKCSWPRVGSYLYQQEIVCPEEPPSFTSQHFQKTSKQQTLIKHQLSRYNLVLALICEHFQCSHSDKITMYESPNNLLQNAWMKNNARKTNTAVVNQRTYTN